MSETRENSGTLSRNQDKSKPDANPSWPDYKGSAKIAGREFWLSGWIKDGQRGKFLSLAFKEKDAEPTKGNERNADEDNMPF